VARSRWEAWHEPYDRPGSFLARRLRVVQEQISNALTAQPPGPIRAVSVCAGQGRDLLGVLARHPRGRDVSARLVELDPANATTAATAAQAFPGVEVVCGDAARTDVYEGAVPAELVLVCGVFGNVVDADIERTIRALPQLCARAALVIWTRHRRPPDITPSVRGWFASSGFDEIAFVAPDDAFFSVGSHRFVGEPEPLERGVQLFEFFADADGRT
jgi:hypothetical protein